VSSEAPSLLIPLTRRFRSLEERGSGEKKKRKWKKETGERAIAVFFNYFISPSSIGWAAPLDQREERRREVTEKKKKIGKKKGVQAPRIVSSTSR